MQIKRVVSIEILVIFLAILIIKVNSDRPEYSTEIPRTVREEILEPNLDTLTLLNDYHIMDLLRRIILDHFPKDDLFFIGQSIALVGQIMIIRNQLEPSTSRTIRLVPFSGNYFRINSTKISPLDLNQHIRKHENLPTEEELANYKDFLRGFGLDPVSIVERYNRTGRRTGIIKKVTDFVNLMSFMDILFNWARLEEIDANLINIALSVFVVSTDLSRHSQLTRIIDGEFNVEMVYKNPGLNSDVFRRIGYPERFRGYVRLIPNYPHQLWNEPPPGFDFEHERRREVLIIRFTEVIRIDIEHANSINSTLTWVCRSHGSRSKRDLSSPNLTMKQMYLIWNLNKYALKSLEVKHFKSSSRISFDEFFADQLKNSSSTVSEILDQACYEHDYSRYHYDVTNESDEIELADQVPFSPNKTFISRCMINHKLFHCSERYASKEIVIKIAGSVAKKFSGKVTTKEDVNKEVEKLINYLANSNPKFPVDYLIEATTEAALYCSDEKILSTLECPSPNYEYLAEIMVEWFSEPRAEEFVVYH